MFNYLTDIKLLTKFYILKARYSLTVLKVPLNPRYVNYVPCDWHYMYIYVEEMVINAAADAAYSDSNSVTKALS